LIGGLVVVLPVAILIVVFQWLFNLVIGLIQPLTNALMATSNVRGFLANIIALLISVVLCFLIGVSVQTGVGRWLHDLVDTRLLSIAPGYNLIRETVVQLFGGKKAPLSRVALVDLFGSETMTTAFITDENPDGTITVYVPQSPSPLTGNVYHLKPRYVHPIDTTVEEAMRTVISFGAGSSKFVGAKKK
jgi:uncharacterized membrane protein